MSTCYTQLPGVTISDHEEEFRLFKDYFKDYFILSHFFYT